jgi:hypothetical protein
MTSVRRRYLDGVASPFFVPTGLCESRWLLKRVLLVVALFKLLCSSTNVGALRFCGTPGRGRCHRSRHTQLTIVRNEPTNCRCSTVRCPTVYTAEYNFMRSFALSINFSIFKCPQNPQNRPRPVLDSAVRRVSGMRTFVLAPMT